MLLEQSISICLSINSKTFIFEFALFGYLVLPAVVWMSFSKHSLHFPLTNANYRRCFSCRNLHHHLRIVSFLPIYHSPFPPVSLGVDESFLYTFCQSVSSLFFWDGFLFTDGNQITVYCIPYSYCIQLLVEIFTNRYHFHSLLVVLELEIFVWPALRFCQFILPGISTFALKISQDLSSQHLPWRKGRWFQRTVPSHSRAKQYACLV